MVKRMEEAKRKEQQRVAELVDLSGKLQLLGGLWTNDAQVDGLAMVKQSAKGGGKGKMTEALKTQSIIDAKFFANASRI